jgi:predicted anti-sigma-YlaC factor YlaD
VGHLTDEDLVLHHYGEPVDAERVQHLRDCAECARAYASLARTLSSITVPQAPDPEPAFWVQVRERATERLAGRTLRLALLVWLVPIVYPFAVRVLRLPR